MFLISSPKPTSLLSTKAPLLLRSLHFSNKTPIRRMGTNTDSQLSLIHETTGEAPIISLQEWQGWGTTSSPVPSMVIQVIHELKLLESQSDSHMTFGGNHGKLSGDFKVQEDKKHRAKYASLDNEEKIQFFSARQIACRLLGSRGYLCQKCWLPMEDCMCSRIMRLPLWHRVRFWLYMHPKDFLRQNNTGKLLWQIFGLNAATLCLFGIAEHEQMMWNELDQAGRDKVWCLYPNSGGSTQSVKDGISCNLSANFESQTLQANRKEETMHFILIDGTWSNSGAMSRRLQDHAELIWGQGLPCLSLNNGVSLMHKLRPQPSWDRTCTAAAAMGLLYELHQIPELNSFELDKQAEAIERALEILLESLTSRRLRMGRSISRKERHNRDIC